MRRARMKARWLWPLVALVVASCKDDPPPPAPPVDSLTACVEQPTALQTPPSGQLPCELLPPGFSR
ncbi:hypothetical protein [Vitiosangium sp. GDMCC 1.1324]|uniref:hypothetical protein n=1 Tax=Vitiosangium sp. (strain GDMCC 1.1324) TaxID=2138576 RepID=UPI000D3D970B|nr:hypothetical protein [Vitiosangium sp. GDMCC 1.1324]PTL77863.1 hypothetical protein DAT35_42450 [Vitiosangium sp. GDMCC 1.1324]